MKKLLAVVWLAVWTVLPMSVALGTDTKAKGDELMTAKGVVVAARSWNISADPAVRHAHDSTPPRRPSIVHLPKLTIKNQALGTTNAWKIRR